MLSTTIDDRFLLTRQNKNAQNVSTDGIDIGEFYFPFEDPKKKKMDSDRKNARRGRDKKEVSFAPFFSLSVLHHSLIHSLQLPNPSSNFLPLGGHSPSCPCVNLGFCWTTSLLYHPPVLSEQAIRLLALVQPSQRVKV